MGQIYPVAVSPQIRIILAGEELEIPLVRSQNLKFVVQRFSFLAFSEQGEQDLIVTLKAGNKPFFRSGHFEIAGTGIVSYPKQTRSECDEGTIFNSVSSSSREGYCDNFPQLDSKIPIIISANSIVSAFVKNQSAVYDHPVQVALQGFFAE